MAGTVPRFTVALSPAVAPVVGKYCADTKPVGPIPTVRYLIPAPEYEVTARALLLASWETTLPFTPWFTMTVTGPDTADTLVSQD